MKDRSKYWVYGPDDLIIIEPTKHLPGQHDQRTHGRWASGATISDAVREKLGIHERASSDRDFEVATIIDPNTGEVVLVKPGTSNQVEFDALEQKLLKGTILTHNHPGGSSFSGADIIFAHDYELAEIRVTSGSGSSFKTVILRPIGRDTFPVMGESRRENFARVYQGWMGDSPRGLGGTMEQGFNWTNQRIHESSKFYGWELTIERGE